MKIQKYTFPKSSFLSIDKDMALISNYIVRNTRLKKLLYYTSKDALSRPSLTEDETISLFGKNIKDIISSPSLNIHSVDGITYFNYCVGLSEYRLKHSNISYNGKLFDYDTDNYTLAKENNKFNINNTCCAG